MKYTFKLNDPKVDELLADLIERGIDYEIGSQCGSDITITTP